MKNLKFLVFALLVATLTANAQKDELKTLKKIHAKEILTPQDISDFRAAVVALEPLAQVDVDKIAYNYYKNVATLLEINQAYEANQKIADAKLSLPYIKEVTSTFQNTLDFEKSSGKKVFTDKIAEFKTRFAPIAAQVGFNYNNENKAKEASDMFYASYLLDPATQGMSLYYAAVVATQAQDFTNALPYFLELKKIGFTGEGTNFFATNKETKKEELFGNATQRDLFIKAGSHEKPRDEKIPSKKPEIYKLIAEIYSLNKDTDNAKAAFTDAIALSPNDTELLVSNANMYYNLGEVETYKKMIGEIIEKDPNNAKLYYNLGYASLKDDDKLVKQINEVINSDKKKFAELDKQRKEMYKKALPYFEKSYQLDATNADTIEFLKFCYRVLEMEDKQKEFENK